MTRKIQAIALVQAYSTSSITPVNLPVGGRLLWVQGEGANKPTFDFTVTYYSGNGSAYNVCSTRYVGTKNGGKVQLFNDWPQVPTSTSTTAVTLGSSAIQITPGADVSIQVYYNNASLNEF